MGWTLRIGRVVRGLTAACALVVVGQLLGGCAAGPGTDLMADALPDDFSLGVTVYSPQREPALAAALPRPMRPARYIVEPDWTLHAAIGPGSTPRTYPPQTRQLTQQQVEQLWQRARQAGLVVGSQDGRIPSADGYDPPADRTVAVVTITHSGTLETRAIELDEPGARAAAVFIDRLAEQAWVRR